MSGSESSPAEAAPAAAGAHCCMAELDTVSESKLDSELSESDEPLDDAAPAALDAHCMARFETAADLSELDPELSDPASLDRRALSTLALPP